MHEFFRRCSVLPKCLQNHKSRKGFVKEFRRLFSCKEAKDAKNVLYAFVCEKKIPRVKLKSNILYIGLTKQNLSKRYLRYAKTFGSNFNWSFFSYVIENYGAVKIAYLHFDTVELLKQAETKLLADYYKLYSEYPPKNAQWA